MMTPYPASLRHRQQGLTLVELMISVTLSLIIMAGIFQIFMSSKQTYRVQEALGRVQENSRFAADLLSYDIRMAGNVGCNKDVAITNQLAGQVAEIGSGVEGFDIAGGAGSMFTMLNGAASNLAADDLVPNTDAIFIKGGTDQGEDLAVAMASSNDTIRLTGALEGVNDGDLVIIADCDDAEIFQIDNINPALDNITHNGLSKIYGIDAQVIPLNYTAYYIATDANGVSNLYQRRVGTVAGALGVQPEVPLIEGVVDMQILYGETIGNTTAYNTANNVTDMANVTSLRFHLLLATLEDNLTAQDHTAVAADPQNIWFVDDNGNGVQVPFRDNRLYRSITTTIALRN